MQKVCHSENGFLTLPPPPHVTHHKVAKVKIKYKKHPYLCPSGDNLMIRMLWSNEKMSEDAWKVVYVYELSAQNLMWNLTILKSLSNFLRGVTSLFGLTSLPHVTLVRFLA